MVASSNVTAMLQQMQQLQMQQMQQMLVAAQQTSEAAASDAATQPASKKYRKDDCAALTGSATLFWQLPAKRLQEIIEALKPQFDAIATSDFCTDKDVLCRLIWMLSGIKPTLLMSSLGVENYADLIAKIKTAAVRYENDLGPRFGQVTWMVCIG